MTDSILRSYQMYTHTSIVPFPVVVVGPTVASDLLVGETDGFAIDATTADGGTVAVIDTVTPANNLNDVILDASNLVQSGTSPKMVYHLSSPYVRWSSHNLFLNSGSPATQSVTLVTGFVYTYGITGTGSLAGSSGASGTATAGSPVTFTATGTTGTFTVTGSPTTMWINRGTIQVPYLATTGAIRYGIPQSYDAAAGNYGILVEPAGTNLCLQSQEFDAAAGSEWDTVRNITIDDQAATAPDGSITADQIIENTSTGFHGIANDSISFTDVTYTISVYVKDVDRRYVALCWTDASAGHGFGETFDLTSVTVAGGAATGSSTFTSSSIVSVGGGWYRIAATGVAANAVGGDGDLEINLRDDGAAPTMASSRGLDSYLGASKSVYLWGAQFEASAVATSYIPTLGSTVTRALDSITMATSSFSLSAAPFSMYMEAVLRQNVAGNGNLALYSASDRIAEFYTIATNLRTYTQDAGGNSLVSVGTYSYGTSFKAANRWATNDIKGALGGTLGAADTSQGMPSITTLGVGNSGFNTDAAFIERVLIVKRAWNDSELQGLTD